jgi:hypothetical protein
MQRKLEKSLIDRVGGSIGDIEGIADFEYLSKPDTQRW